MSYLFNTFIYQPILNLTVFLYATVGFHDLGLTIIMVTLLTRISALPLSLKTARSQKAMAEIAPEIEKVKSQHKGDMNTQSEAIMRLYKERGINPLAGCLPLLIQLPILIGIYQVFLNVFKPDALNLLYSFVAHPGTLNHISFGFLDVGRSSHILAVLAGVLQFFQAKITMQNQPQSPQASALNSQMMYFLPIMIVVIGWKLPAGLSIYWITTTLFGIGEQLYLRRRSGILPA